MIASWWLIHTDQFGFATILDDGVSEWNACGIQIKRDWGLPCYSIRCSEWPPNIFITILEPGNLFRTHDNDLTETWDHKQKEWCITGYTPSAPRGYWLKTINGAQHFNGNDITGGDDEDDPVGAE